MYRKLLVGGLIVALAAVCWNEYRVWNKRSTPGPMQEVERIIAKNCTFVMSIPPNLLNEMEQTANDDCEPAVFIDLNPLAKQTAEPMPAETEEPTIIQVAAQAPSRPMPATLDVPPQFLPHSVDAAPPVAGPLWKRMARYIWGTPSNELTRLPMPEALFVMPSLPYRCPESHGCPYHGGSSHPTYSQPVVKPVKFEVPAVKSWWAW